MIREEQDLEISMQLAAMVMETIAKNVPHNFDNLLESFFSQVGMQLKTETRLTLY